MKKTFALLLITCIVLSMMGCTNSAVKRTSELISNIGEITESSGDAIEAAEKAYAALTDDQKNQIENYEILLDARENYDGIVIAAELNRKIDDILAQDAPTQAEIDELSSLYETLPDSQRSRVHDYDKAVSLRDCEIAAIQAVNQYKKYLDSPSSLELISVSVKMNVETMGGNAVLVQYSATNGFGGRTKSSFCLDITSSGTDVMLPVGVLLGKIDTVSATNLQYYVAAPEKAIKLDCDRIMSNLDAVK